MQLKYQHKTKVNLIFFENDNLDIYQIQNKYSQMINKYNHLKTNGIKPTIKDNRNNYLLIREIEIINTNDLFEL